MTSIYTGQALVTVNVSMERLCEMVTESRTTLEVSILPIGDHNPLWKENRAIFDRITVRGFLDRPSVAGLWMPRLNAW
jgi:hypothetical protein